jgi:membrane-associated phospholipid phosphatase
LTFATITAGSDGSEYPEEGTSMRFEGRFLGFTSGSVLVAFLATTLVPSSVPASSGDGENDALQTTGDILQVALPASAFLSTFFVGDPQGNRWDRQGSKQFLFSFGASWLTTRLLKEVAAKMRPNGVARTSWPSGHTNAAFSGAAFLGTRYGGIWGWLGYGGAVLTGYSRIESQWHFADDVVAGASIAMLYNWALVTPHHSRIRVMPEVSEDQVGVTMTVRTDEAGKSAPVVPERPIRYRYDFLFGPAYMYKNEITSPSDGGTTFDLNNFSKRDDPTTTSAVFFEFHPHPRHEVFVTWFPFEARDDGTFPDSVSFGGQTFPPDTKIQSAWRLYDLRGQWSYKLVDSERWDPRLGAGLALQDTYTALATDDGSTQATVEDVRIFPYAYAGLGFRISEKFGARAYGSGIGLSEEWMVDAGIMADYHLNRHWTFSLGYFYYNRNIVTEEIGNSVIYNIPAGSVAYAW